MAATASTKKVPYSSNFYDKYSGESRRGAAAVVPLVLTLIGGASSVLDVGCGIGTWLAEFSAAGITDLVGVDGAYIDVAQFQASPEIFSAHDLSLPLSLNRQFDLVTTLEVAEHIAPECAEIFVDSLTRHSQVVLFSAAIPGQGGDEHVNERWQSWWAGRFASRGFNCFDLVRPAIWDQENVPWYYKQNTLIFAKGPMSERLAKLTPASILDLVHPGQWERRRTSLKGRVIRLLPPSGRKILDKAAELRSQIRGL